MKKTKNEIVDKMKQGKTGQSRKKQEKIDQEGTKKDKIG